MKIYSPNFDTLYKHLNGNLCFMRSGKVSHFTEIVVTYKITPSGELEEDMVFKENLDSIKIEDLDAEERKLYLKCLLNKE